MHFRACPRRAPRLCTVLLYSWICLRNCANPLRIEGRRISVSVRGWTCVDSWDYYDDRLVRCHEKGSASAPIIVVKDAVEKDLVLFELKIIFIEQDVKGPMRSFNTEHELRENSQTRPHPSVLNVRGRKHHGQVRVKPIMTPTRGCLWENPEHWRGTPGVHRSI